MNDYDSDKLKALCDDFDLLGYIEQSGYEPKRKGDQYAMRCPIHANDDTPSLFINPDKQRWYCFGCKNNGSIIDWMIRVEHLTFPKAIEKLKELTGVDVTPTATSSSFNFFKSMANIANKEEKSIGRTVLPESYLNQFEIPPDGEPYEWIAEGISPAMIRKYGIRIDSMGNRIIYPVYDNDGNLIGAKGRTRFKNYKLIGVRKYANYTKIGTTNYFQGMHENRAAILDKSEVIIFESIKSVMLADGWGYPNCVAAETSCINDDQAKILIQMGINSAVIAFDNDVSLPEVKKSADKLRHFMNVWIVHDKRGLLGDKSEKLAPVDKGKDVWHELYMERKRIE